jgi:hypothetical protein
MIANFLSDAAENIGGKLCAHLKIILKFNDYQLKSDVA